MGARNFSECRNCLFLCDSVLKIVLKIVEIRERRKSVNIPMLVHIRQKLPLVSTFKIILGIYINHFPEPFSVYVCGVCV